MSRIEAVYAASRNLYPYLPASVTSLLEHNPDARVWLLVEDDALPYELPGNVEVVNVSGQKFFSPGTCRNWRTGFTYLALIRSAYAKLFSGEPGRSGSGKRARKNGLTEYGVRPLPKLDRILQLDVDTIVCDSLEPVWETDMDGKWFAAVPDYPGDHRPLGRKKYYNVGLCLFNLEQIRRDGADDRAIGLCNDVKMQYVDEMAWNELNNELGIELGNELKNELKSVDLDPRYNQTTEVPQTLDAAVVHYAGINDWWKDFGNMYRPWYMMAYAKHFQMGCAVKVDAPALNWIVDIMEDGNVRYMMENGGYPVRAEMPFGNALALLKKGEVKISERFQGFPLTADDVFFFAGDAETIKP